MSNLWSADDAGNVTAVGLGGVSHSVASSPRPGFRALYADGQTVARSVPTHSAVEENEDPLEQMRIEAFTMGFEEGHRVASETLAADQQAMADLTEALGQLAPASGTLSTMLSSAVIRLVAQIVGEVEVDTALLLERCQTVATFIEDNEGKTALHLNPEDVPLIEEAGIGVPIIADANLRRGAVRLDTAEGWIEDGPDVRLSRLKAMLDNMEGRA